MDKHLFPGSNSSVFEDYWKEQEEIYDAEKDVDPAWACVHVDMENF
jgi:hypothetical protein